MEVRLGYKQTDAGEIPEDWDVRALGKIASISAGGTPSRRVPEYWKDEIPWVTTTEIDFTTITHTEQYISKTGLRNSAAKLLSPGTLLLALYGQGKTRGKVAVLGIEAATNQACASILVTPSVSRDFVFCFLASRYEVIRGLSNSGSQENLNGRIVKSILIAFPPTQAEQEDIAKALSDASALIGSLERLIAKKRNIKQGAMQELLTGKKRLPGFENPIGRKQTEAGVIPKDWEVRTIGQLALIKTGPFGTLLKASEYSENGVPLISVGEIREGYLRIAENTPRISSAVTRRLPQYLLRTGDIVFGRKGGVQRSVLIRPEQNGWFLGSDGITVRPTKDCNSAYLAFQFQSARVQEWLLRNAIGTTMPSLNQDILCNLAVPVPPTSAEQECIVAVLNDMDADLAALEGKLGKARQLKHGMMQELLIGRTRLV